MATATQAASSTAPDILQGIEEQAILAAYQKTETHGLEFGRLCYDYREKHGAQGSRTGSGLAQILRKLGIKEGKAYYWLAAYEVSIGERVEPEEKPALTRPAGCAHCRSTLVAFKCSENKDGKRLPIYLCESCIEPYILSGHSLFIADNKWWSDSPALSTNKMGGGISGWGRANPEESARKALENATTFLQDASTKMPNYASELREELQTRNLLTPSLDAKLKRFAQIAKESPEPTPKPAPAVAPSIKTSTEAVQIADPAIVELKEGMLIKQGGVVYEVTDTDEDDEPQATKVRGVYRLVMLVKKAGA
jgi:hypothetical protein